jgi:hypothetical protein
MGMLSAEFPKEIAEELINYLIDMEEKDQEFAHLFLAADCYGELRNQSIYVELSQRLLNQLERLYDKDIDYYEKYDPEKWWQQRGKIRGKSIFCVVKNWQGDPNGWNMLQKIAQSATSWPEQAPIIDALVQIAQLYPVALSKIQELANKGESEAIEALANHWRDNPQTLPIIQQQANKGKSEAIKALATHWRDNPQTLPIIQQLANSEREIGGLVRVLGRIPIDSEIGAIIETILARKDLDSDIKEKFRELLGRNNFRELRNPDQDSQHERGGGGHFSTLRTKIGGHFSTLRTKITDAEILVKSLQDLGIIVKREADVRGSSSQRVRVDIVAVLEGDYDLGWIRNTDGSFDLIADLWGVAQKHSQTELINSINQKYAVNKTLKEVKERGLNKRDL